MPLLAYFVVVGTILMGMVMLAETAIGPPPPLWFSNNSQGLPQHRIPPPEIPTAQAVPPPPMTASIIPQAVKLSVAQASAFAPSNKRTNLAGKQKTPKMEVTHHETKGADGDYYMRLAQENYGKSW
jgi:hypothetical protein